ncbi:MAG: helix-turn-helix domain-containing protein [Erysipelotrichaceae bacterium]
MRKVELRMNEQEKYEVIKELVDKKGNKKRAALKLRLSVRQINRLIKVYKEKGKSGFLHQNRNRKPVNSLPQELTDYIVNFIGMFIKGLILNILEICLKIEKTLSFPTVLFIN